MPGWVSASLLALVLLVFTCCTRTIEIGKRDAHSSSDGLDATVDVAFDQIAHDARLDDARSQPPSLGWARSFGSSRYDYASAIDLHRATDTLFIIGTFENRADLGTGTLSARDQGIVVASYAADGTPRWARSYDGGSDAFGWDRGTGIAVSAAGDVYFTGSVVEGAVDFGGGPLAGGQQDVFVASLNRDGDYRWAKRWQDQYASSGNYGRSVAVNNAGDLVVAGSYSPAIDFGDGPLAFIGDFNPFVMVLDLQGNLRWSRGASSGSGDFSDGGFALVAANRAVYLLGGYSGVGVDFGADKLSSTGVRGAYIAAFGSDGTPSWLRGVNQTSGASVWPSSGAIDRAGNVYLLADLQGEMLLEGQRFKGQGGVIVSYGADGVFRWGFALPSKGAATAIKLDTQGNLYVSGTFAGTTDFGDGPRTAAGATDAFLVSYTPNRRLRWAFAFGSDQTLHNSDQIRDLVIADDGVVYAVGSFRGRIDLGGTTLQSKGEFDGFVMALTPRAR
jgi:hypothetical protein